MFALCEGSERCDFLNLVCLSKDSVGKVLCCIGLLKVESLKEASLLDSGSFMYFLGGLED